jgi:hypothetical protein
MSKTRQLSDAINSVDISQSAPDDAVTLDASGNLLVGKTAIGQGTAGFEARATGQTFCTDDGNTPFLVNRLTSDGELIQLNKDGTNVGSIGVADSGDRIYLAGGGLEGVGIDNGANAFVPTSQVGAYKDGHLALGRSDARFTNLYLSGGVYLGGTGAANKLDDYEEGTFTATLTAETSGSISLSRNTLYYEKIGNQVTVSGILRVSSVSSPTGGLIMNLPFTVDSSLTEYEVGASIVGNSLTGGNEAGTLRAAIQSSVSKLRIWDSDNGAALSDGASLITSNTTLRIGATYRSA